MQFKRSISIFALLLTAIGGMVGSGWLFGPLYAAQVAGPAAVISWIIGGLLMMVVAFVFAELSATFPVAGGMVRFAEWSHGPLMSFTVGWMVWLSSMVVAPIETLALLQYASNYFPQLTHNVAGVPVLTSIGFVIASLLMLVMVILNNFGARWFGRMSFTLVMIKLFVPVLTLMTLLLTAFHPNNFTDYPNFMPNGWHGVLAALPLGGVIFSFIGNSPAIQLAAEAKHPQRALPLAIIGSIVFCIALYALLQFTFIGAVESSLLKQGWQQLHFSGETGPFAGIVSALGITWLLVLIYGDALISPFGTAFIYTGATSRVNVALQKSAFFPAVFGKLNRHGVPAFALIFNYVLGLLMFLPFPSWQSMVSFIVSCFVISYSIGPLALMPLRQPKTTFRLPYGHAFAFIAFYICNLLVYWTGWSTVAHLLIAMLVGLVVFACRYYRLATVQTWRTARWLLLYFIGIGVISYAGAFGGKQWLSFGVDFAVILVFSGIIYSLAMCSHVKQVPELH